MTSGVKKAACVFSTLLACAFAVQAQPAFEAASLKPDKLARRPNLEGGPGSSDPGRIRFSNISLRFLILEAYRVRGFQLAAADPKGLDARGYELIAKLPPTAGWNEVRAMLRQLLAERFHLTVHREQKSQPGYALTLAKSGPKLKPSALDAPPPSTDDFDPLPPAPPNELEVHEDGYPNVPPREGSWMVALRSGYARMRQRNASMADLAGILSNHLERPVSDATGLVGRYEFTLSWLTATPAAMPPQADPGPDLFGALKQQLGLQLEPKIVPVEMLAIDHFDKDPVEN